MFLLIFLASPPALFLLIFLASPPALVAGLIRPKWVLPWVKSPTRLLSTTVYSATLVGSLILASLTSSRPERPVAVQPAPQPSQSIQPVENLSPEPSPAPSVEPSPTPSVESIPSPESVSPSLAQPLWRLRLPTEDATLRTKFEQDAFLKSWLSAQDVWIGYANAQDLNQRGFFVNTQWKSNGLGTDSAIDTTYGSCSAIGFNGEFACSVGAFDSPNWGVQSDDAIEAFKRFMRESEVPDIEPAETVAASNLPSCAQNGVCKCSDFENQAQAQEALEQFGQAKLDRDRDGVACESM